MAYDVFISHSSRDKPAADGLCAALEAARIRCWIAPRDLIPGRPFSGEIIRGIKSCRVMVLVFSASSNASPDVLREVQLATRHRLHLINFRIEQAAVSEDLDYFLGIPHWLDALTQPMAEHYTRLAESVKALLALDPPVPAPAEVGGPTPDSAHHVPGEFPESLESIGALEAGPVEVSAPEPMLAAPPRAEPAAETEGPAAVKETRGGAEPDRAPARKKVTPGGRSRWKVAAALLTAVAVGWAIWFSLSKKRVPQAPESTLTFLPLPPLKRPGWPADLVAASETKPWVNSLEMKFVRVPIVGGRTDGKPVFFSIYETRVKDYAAYAEGKTDLNMEWKEPTKGWEEQAPSHPVVAVNFSDAKAFCQWLTEKEHQAGTLPAELAYRLPSDHEWSCAVGLAETELEPAQPKPDEPGGHQALYPWGAGWPPPIGAGNYPEEHAQRTTGPLQGLEDRYPFTSPVGRFMPNKYGLYDLGGNAEELCESEVSSPFSTKARGASWFSATPTSSLAAYRDNPSAGFRINTTGFRVVLAETAKSGDAAPAVVAANGSAGPAVKMGPANVPTVAAEAKAPDPAPAKVPPFVAKADGGILPVNSLGMPLAAVPIHGGPTDGKLVLFCIYETRVQDWAVYEHERPGGDKEWNGLTYSHEKQEPTHPAVNISWNEAQAFCAWLTERERRLGKLKEGLVYRLPTDLEWSCAVGVKEAPGKNSEEDVFPWGTAWPPPAGAGNYADATAKAKSEISDEGIWVEGKYDDGVAFTAPVGSYAPNIFGLYDLGGNAWELCEGWSDEAHNYHDVRGGSWRVWLKKDMRSGYRSMATSDSRNDDQGFRVVVAEPVAK